MPPNARYAAFKVWVFFPCAKILQEKLPLKIRECRKAALQALRRAFFARSTPPDTRIRSLKRRKQWKTAGYLKASGRFESGNSPRWRRQTTRGGRNAFRPPKNPRIQPAAARRARNKKSLAHIGMRRKKRNIRRRFAAEQAAFPLRVKFLCESAFRPPNRASPMKNPPQQICGGFETECIFPRCLNSSAGCPAGVGASGEPCLSRGRES